MGSGGTEFPQSLLLVQWGRRGAGGQYLLRLAESLADRIPGRVCVSMSRQSALFEETLATGLPCFPVDTYSGAVSAAARSALLPRLRSKLRAQLDRHRVALTLVCMPHPWGWAVADVFRSCGRRLITVVHDAAPHPGERYPLPTWVIGREIKLSDGLLTLSHHVSRAVASIYGSPPERIFEASLPSLISVKEGRIRSLEARPARLLFLGRVLPYKGLDLLLDAVDRLRGQVPVQLEVVGSGTPAGLAGRIASMPDVQLVDGWIPESELPNIFERADILVAPYREASQSGVVPAAFAAGLPAVVTPVGGLLEQVEHGRSGLVTDACSGEALARSIASLIGDGDLYRRCSAGAIEASRTRLSWAAHAERIEDVVRRVSEMPRL